MTQTKPDQRPVPEITPDTKRAAAEQAEEILRPLLTDGDGPVHVTFGYVNEVSNEYIDTFFDTLMRSAMALGGRRLAIEWKDRLHVQDWAEERAHRRMADTINVELGFGMFSPPLAVQAGCRVELLEHEQQDADCIARLAVRQIATESEVRKMRQRLVKQIFKALTEDTQPQTVGAAKTTPPPNRRESPRRHAHLKD